LHVRNITVYMPSRRITLSQLIIETLCVAFDMLKKLIDGSELRMEFRFLFRREARFESGFGVPEGLQVASEFAEMLAAPVGVELPSLRSPRNHCRRIALKAFPSLHALLL